MNRLAVNRGMSDLPSSSFQVSPDGGESPEETLQAGLAAFKRSDYAGAIQRLSKVSQDMSASSAIRLKARVGLVKALGNGGNLLEAIALCQKLTAYSQPKVQQWAKATLPKLQEKQRAASSSATEDSPTDLSGFQPIEPNGAFSSGETDGAAEPGSNGSPTTSQSQDLSGFQPLPTSDATSATATPNSAPDSYLPQQEQTTGGDETGSTASTEPAAASASDHPSADQALTADNLEPPATASDNRTSLFHYDSLNQTAASSSTQPVAEPPVPSQEAELPPSDPISDEPTSLQFQYGGRLNRLRPLPASGLGRLRIWGIQVVCAIALFWVCRRFIQWVLWRIADALELVERIVYIPTGWRDDPHTIPVILCLVGLLLASPWLLDWLLRRAHDLTPLSLQKLKQTHPEACRLLRRVGQQRGWLLPVLRELPTDAPLIFSYGWLPRYSRIVVSRGLLDQFDDEELATLVGYELTHFTLWTLPFLSLIAVLQQLLYQTYWRTARWGDRHSDRPIKALAALASAVSYGGFWVVRKLATPISRARVREGDRQATEWTGNPNALVRALLKQQSGIADAISQAGETPHIVESMDLLLASGTETAISLGSIYPDASLLESLCWDVQNPYRYWLSINSTHPPLGERIKALTGYALRWQLVPELPFLELASSQRPSRSTTFLGYWVPFLRQASPYIGPFLGIAAAMLLWFLGGIFEPLGLRRIGWVYGDESVLFGSIFLGLGMGIMVRINPYFPDITPSSRLDDPTLPSLLKDPMALPTESRPVRLTGTVIGREGMANWLCQDFILKTSSGLLKLHFLSILGAFGNLFIHPNHPVSWLNQPLAVQGWYRRGAIAWLDVDSFARSGRIVAKANHPMLSVFLSLGACALGLFILLKG